MRKRPSTTMRLCLGILAAFIAGSIIYAGITGTPPVAHASPQNALTGYAWSDNVGWISMSGSGYQVGINGDDTLSGYAWGDNVGWVSFNASDVSSCGAGPTYNPSTSALSGWARALNGVNSDGCISLSGSGYGVVLDGTDHYAWASDTIGWLDFKDVSTSLQPCPNGSGWAGSCTACNSPYVPQSGNCVLPSGSITGNLTATPSRVSSGGSTSLSWSTTGMTSCTVKRSDTGATVSTLTSSSGTPAGSITGTTVFTLTCSDGTQNYTSTVTVGLLPVFKEV